MATLKTDSLVKFINNSEMELITSFNTTTMDKIHIVKHLPTDKEIVYRCDIAEEGTIPCVITDTKEMYISTEGSDHIYANRDSSFTFSGFFDASRIDGLELIDTSNVENMNSMFLAFGSNYTGPVRISGLEHWDTSNVRDMTAVFECVGLISNSFDMDVSNWNVSNVVTMNAMFTETGAESDNVTIGDLSNWNTSNVEDMSFMFYKFAYIDTKCDIGNLSNWDVSNCILMKSTFEKAMAVTKKQIDLRHWNVSNVKDGRRFAKDSKLVQEPFFSNKWG